MTPDKDGWIKHDGGPCPVDPETWVQIKESIRDGAVIAESYVDEARCFSWGTVAAYRVFAPVTPGPSPFVAETAARIMAAIAVHGGSYPTDEKLAEAANRGIRAALALEAELGRIGK